MVHDFKPDRLLSRRTCIFHDREKRSIIKRAIEELNNTAVFVYSREIMFKNVQFHKQPKCSLRNFVLRY